MFQVCRHQNLICIAAKLFGRVFYTRDGVIANFNVTFIIWNTLWIVGYMRFPVSKQQNQHNKFAYLQSKAKQNTNK